MEEGGKSIMLLGYRFSTGNSIAKRALKAMALVICVFYTLVTVNANRGPAVLTWHHLAEKTGSGSKGRKEPHTYESVHSDHKMCVSHAIEDVFQENTIFQVHYFQPFESTRVLRCMLLSDKRCADLLGLTEDPEQDLAFVCKFPLKHILSSKSIRS